MFRSVMERAAPAFSFAVAFWRGYNKSGDKFTKSDGKF